MFLNPIMLIGLGAAVVPVVLHLLSRARYRDVEWGAIMFLEGADARQRQSARLTRWLLLALRSAIIALLAVALARPVLRGRLAGAESEGRVTAALLLDCSASTGYDENGRTRFQMAQSAARQVLRGLRAGDRVSLILMGVRQSVGDLEPTGDLRAVEARIDEARPTAASADLKSALQVAGAVLDRYERAARDVYVICDKQALSWKGIDEHVAGEWKRRMNAPGLSTRMFVLPVGSDDADNVAVTGVRVLNPPAIVGHPVDVEVEVRNYGPVPRPAVPLALERRNEPPVERTVSIEPGKTVQATFTLTFAGTGSHVVAAQVRGAGQTLDDRLKAVVQVIDPVRVLVISGDERPGDNGRFRSESDFLQWALAPHRSAGAAGADPCAVTVLAADAWPAAPADESLGKYQVVVLANVERFTSAEAHALEKYVYNGGRLLVAPGSLSRPDEYNALLYRDGAGILPAMLLDPTPADGSQSTTILGLQSDHPIFQFMRGRYELPSATIGRYFPAVPRQVDADVLARFLSDDPFLIEGRSEHGQVLLMTTSLDADWTTLPLSNFYLPFVQSAVRYLAGGALNKVNLAPGDPLRLAFGEPDPQRVVTLTTPDGRSRRVDVVHLGQQDQVRVGDTEQPGEYRLTVAEPGKPAVVHAFVVHPTHDPEHDESDLSQLTGERWTWLQGALGFGRIDPAKGPVRDVLAAGREGRELWGWALAGVLGLTLLEMLVARAGSVERPHREVEEEHLMQAEPRETEVLV